MDSNDLPLRDTALEIDLDALAENARLVRSLLAPDVKLMGVVKADAYGHGARMAAPVLLENGADCLGVATLNEALELRRAGIACPIQILGYTPPALYPLALAQSITLTIGSREEGTALSRAGRAAHIRAKAHIKVDTGMHRLGFSGGEKDLADILFVCGLPDLFIEGIFTHIAQAGEAADREQFQAFARSTALVEQGGYPLPLKHFCESMAAILYPEYHLDMVRVGTLFYGTRNSERMERKFRPVARLTTKLISTRRISRGDGVGYDHLWRAERDSRIGLLPLGFGDGYSMQMRGRGYVVIRGKAVPVIGSLCMDYCMVDLTDHPQAAAGDEAIVIGDGKDGALTVEQMSDMLGITRGEVLGRITRRVPRLYRQNGRTRCCVDYTLGD